MGYRKQRKVIYVIIALALVYLILDVVGGTNLIGGNWLTINNNLMGMFGLIVGCALCIFWMVNR